MESSDKIYYRFFEESHREYIEIHIRRGLYPMCIAVANRIINRTNAHNTMRRELSMTTIPMNGKRLQKILYLCQLYWIAEGNEGYLISDDFEAWSKGPVVDSIYNVFSVYQDGGMLPYRSRSVKPLSEKERRAVNYIVDATIEIPTEKIIEFTHIANGPWAQIYNHTTVIRPVIPKEDIRSYITNGKNKEQFKKFIEKGELLNG